MDLILSEDMSDILVCKRRFLPFQRYDVALRYRRVHLLSSHYEQPNISVNNGAVALFNSACLVSVHVRGVIVAEQIEDVIGVDESVS